MLAPILSLSIVASFYALAGSRLDVLLNAVLVACVHGSDLTAGFHRFRLGQYAFISVLCGFVLLGIYLTRAPRRHDKSAQPGQEQPYLIPCRTTHRRFSPKKHAFSYSYLTVGIPVDYKGSANGMIEMDESSAAPVDRCFPLANLTARSWYCVHAADHLQRGHSRLSLREKLDSYLQSEVRL